MNGIRVAETNLGTRLSLHYIHKIGGLQALAANRVHNLDRDRRRSDRLSIWATCGHD